MRYEYTTLRFQATLDEDNGQRLAFLLDEYGNAGWRVIHVDTQLAAHMAPPMNGMTSHTNVLERFFLLERSEERDVVQERAGRFGGPR